VFVNDTSGTSNPGCQGTVAGLDRLLMDCGFSIRSRIPVGYAYKLLQVVPPNLESKNLAARIARKIAPNFYSSISSSPDQLAAMAEANRIQQIEQWQNAVSTLADRFTSVWRDLDYVVINGEGTIHHDSIGARTVLAICASAKRLEKRVALVNCSIFELDDFLLGGLRENVDDLVVREPVSFRYLKENGIQATLLFLANNAGTSRSEHEERERANAKPYVVYTPGVLAGSGVVEAEMVANDVSQLIKKGYDVSYYVVEREDEKFAEVASRHGAKIVHIFAALAKTPFVPLETNTQKMRGLLELLGVSATHPIRSWGADDSMLDLDTAVDVDPAKLEDCIELARKAMAGLNSELVV